MTTRAAAAKCDNLSLAKKAEERGLELPKSISNRSICTLINIVPPAEGVKLNDYYVLKRLLGQGNFGQVWLANDKKTDEPFALKVLENMTEDSKREVAVLSVLSKQCKADNVVCYYDHFRALSSLGKRREQLFYVIVTEYIEGIEMHKWISNWYADNKKAPPKATLHKFAQSLLKALAFIHKNKVYHLDVKPSNIIIRKSNEECTLIDFGLACTTRSKNPDATCVGTEGYGTPGYMSPDYASNCLLNFELGLCNEASRSGTDIWAFGMTMLSTVQPREIGEEFQNIYEETVLKNNYAKKDEKAFLKLLSTPESLPKFKVDEITTSVIYSALTVDPKDRPSAAELLKMFK